MEMRKDVSRLSQRRFQRPDLEEARARMGVLGLWPPKKRVPKRLAHREYVCVTEAIRRCWEEQVASSCNIFIETHDNIARRVEISRSKHVPNALCL
jgi:hypothetical protein